MWRPERRGKRGVEGACEKSFDVSFIFGLILGRGSGRRHGGAGFVKKAAGFFETLLLGVELGQPQSRFLCHGFIAFNDRFAIKGFLFAGLL